MSTVTHYQSVLHATEINNKRKPFDDPRVRRAMHLALDRPALIEVVKDVAPMMGGGFLYPFSELAAPSLLVKISTADYVLAVDSRGSCAFPSSR
jgi:ABC-type transport system substrate-binding protein